MYLLRCGYAIGVQLVHTYLHTTFINRMLIVSQVTRYFVALHPISRKHQKVIGAISMLVSF